MTSTDHAARFRAGAAVPPGDGSQCAHCADCGELSV